jgi:hypothetical protein
VPPLATTIPAIAGPTMKHTVNEAFISALPCASMPTGLRTDTAAARASDRAVSAQMPSSRASDSTATRSKWCANQASPANSTASIPYSAGSTFRDGLRSSRATSHGDSGAGANCAHRKKPIAPTALPVRR